MQVGDLVQLSASGQRLKWAKRFKNKVGIIIRMRYPNWIEVRWCGYEGKPSLMVEMFSRSNLKRARLRMNGKR
tara:strand:- start:215 stop:433 length:219 start_codon:yes stop_codon:yes gene_type:complete